MLNFTPDIILQILQHVDSEIANDLEMDAEELETIAEKLTDDEDLQGMISDQM